MAPAISRCPFYTRSIPGIFIFRGGMRVIWQEICYKDPTASVTGMDMRRLTGPLAAT